MTFAVVMLLKPLVAMLVMVPVCVLSRLILARLPDGPIKTLLSRRVGP